MRCFNIVLSGGDADDKNKYILYTGNTVYAADPAPSIQPVRTVVPGPSDTTAVP